MKLSIDKQIDEQTKEIFTFYIFDLNIVFVAWSLNKKEKRTWKTITFWDNYNKRDSRSPEPILSEEIKKEVLLKVKNLIQVKTWKEYKKY